jgi:hypothetical protein
MGASNIILSSNLPIRIDGLPRANRPPDGGDSGVAVYFKRHGKDMVFACDKFFEVCDNIYAIAKTIDAMRGIERWGASDMMDRAFSGFVGLPAKSTQEWRDVLSMAGDSITVDQIESQFRILAKKYHPDAGGDRDQFELIVKARSDALREISK